MYAGLTLDECMGSTLYTIVGLRDIKFERDCRLHGLRMVKEEKGLLPGALPPPVDSIANYVLPEAKLGTAVLGEQRFG